MYRISDTVRATHGQDGAVVLDIEQGRVLRFNLTGSFILQCVQRGETESQIIDGISQRFCISRDLAKTDVGEFLHSMEQEGLLHMDAPTRRV